MKQINIVNQKKIINDFFVVGFLFFVFLTPFLTFSLNRKDFICVLSFLANGLIFIIGIFQAQKKHSISMELIYWIFMFFFMYYAPVLQYLLSIYPWHGALTNNEILYANLIIFIFNVFFIIGRLVSKRIKFKGLPNINLINFLCTNFEFKKKTQIGLTISVCLLAAYSLSKTGLMGIIVSRAQATQTFYSGNNSAIELIVESVIPAFVAYVVSDAAQSMVNKKENCLRFLILFTCLLICFFPTTIPRYKTATIYGVVFLVLFPQVKKGSRFFWFFTIALFFAFPLLNSFRNIISWESFLSAFEDGFFKSYTEGDYDAYRMLVSSIRYIKDEGFTWGYQLLGVLLFFIPKSIWASKPIGSGAMLIRSELGNNVFANVSCPFIAESYVNFGIFGIILFALFLGSFIFKMDKGYWANAEKNRTTLFSPYLFMVFMLFFVLRGDLLSGFAYVCGFIATGYLFRILAKRI